MNSYNKHMKAVMTLLIAGLGHHVVVADILTYSPDQWPRHWNVSMSDVQKHNEQRYQNKYRQNKPLRSPAWGVMPVVKPRPRRTLRPEYHIRYHEINYPGNNIYQRNYYSMATGYGLANPYNSPLLVPGLLPLFGAPTIPYMSNPYVVSPFTAVSPVSSYMW